MRSTGMMLRNGGLCMLAVAMPLALLAANTSAIAQSAPQDDEILATLPPAALIISSAATQNVKCKAGVCHATARQAVLNAKMLQRLLTRSAVRVVSGSLAKDIQITAAVTWVSANTLTLDAFHSISIAKPVSDAGAGGLTLITNDGGVGGTLSFGAKGNVTFLSTTNALTINGNVYTLVNNLAALATDVTANASGNYALSGKINATADGTYHSAPVSTVFTGTFEGLGNTISNLKVIDSSVSANIGLFAHMAPAAMCMIRGS